MQIMKQLQPFLRTMLLAVLALTPLCAVAQAADANAAAQQAASATGGRVLDVQSASAGGQPVYVVRVLLPDGRVKVVRIDGATSGAPGRH